MNTLYKTAAIGVMLLLGSLAFAQTNDSGTQTQAPPSDSSTLSKVVYPIADLGNCDSRDACRIYCDDTSHRDACFAFALKAGLMTKEKIDVAKTILTKKGPGGCDSKDSCIAYCADSSHSDECLSFAEAHKVIATSTVMLIKKFNAGEGPGACKSAESCRAYCTDSSHSSECKAFAQENGLIPRMGTSSDMRFEPPHMGSSTSQQVHMILASTTPGQGRGMELHERASSTTPAGAGDIRRPQLPPRPSTVIPTPDSGENQNLGSAVITAFVHLLGF